MENPISESADQRELRQYIDCLGFEPIPFSPARAAEIAPTDEFLALKLSCDTCVRCPLHQSRKRSVFGIGNLNPDILFVGEAPSAVDEEAGEPFAGPSGELLDKMILAMGYTRQSVFLTHVTKCRPPNNRNPELFEIAKCHSYLLEQIKALRPKVIVALGSIAAKTLVDSELALEKIRGNFMPLKFRDPTIADHLTVMPTLHPAYLIKSPESKKLAWEDLKKVMSLLKEGVS